MTDINNYYLMAGICIGTLIVPVLEKAFDAIECIMKKETKEQRNE